MASNIARAIVRKAVDTASAILLTVLTLPAVAAPAAAYTDGELALGFFRTVFGAEHKTWGWRSDTVKKYTGRVRIYIDSRSSIDRSRAVAAFVNALPDRIRGLDVRIVSDPAQANYRIYIVDRSQYASVVSSEVYRRPAMPVPGLCLVRVISGSRGIRRSDAVIVSDEGEVQFRRCMVEEILQGLGPVNDSADLDDSVFNDTSKHIRFTRYDRLLLNMLYDPRIEAGMSEHEVARVLPLVIRDVRRRVP